MTPPENQDPPMNVLATGIPGLVLIAFLTACTLGSFWVSHVPQLCVLSVFGEKAQAEIVESKPVRDASAPDDRFVHAVEFTSRDGKRQSFEISGESLHEDLHGVFSVHYLPLWPAVVLIDGDPRLRMVFLFVGMLMMTVLGLFLALTPNESGEDYSLVRILLRLRGPLVERLRRLWDL